MLKIDRAIINQLGFDFDAALRQFKAEKELHPSTVDVPAPSANPFVEAAYAAGGYEVVEPEPEPEPTIPEQPVFQPDPRKAAALERLSKLQGKAAGAQLDEIRALLAQIFEMLPG